MSLSECNYFYWRLTHHSQVRDSGQVWISRGVTSNTRQTTKKYTDVGILFSEWHKLFSQIFNYVKIYSLNVMEYRYYLSPLKYFFKKKNIWVIECYLLPDWLWVFVHTYTPYRVHAVQLPHYSTCTSKNLPSYYSYSIYLFFFL